MIHIIGEILVDIFLDGKNEEVHPGGAPFNVACNISRLGGNVSFYGTVGKDEYGKFLTKTAKKLHFQPLLLNKSSRSTTKAVVSLKNGERDFRFERENGADYIFSLKSLEKLNIKKGDIVHFGSLMLSEARGRKFFFKAVEYAKNKGAILSFDINYRYDIFKDECAAGRYYRKALKCFDLVKISEDEVFYLSGRKSILRGLSYLFNENQTVFVTLGSKGSFMYQKGDTLKVETKKVTPIDTTGAGDAFYSYVLYALSKNENDYTKILSYANAMGALATLQKGAIREDISIELIESFLK